MADKNNKTIKIIMTGLMIALIVTATILIIIPIPFSNGYIHFGDAMIFLSVLILGWRYGAIAAGLGSALADILIGFAVWAPWTLVIKGLMGVVMGLFILKSMGKQEKNIIGVPFRQLAGMVLAGLVMVGGYYIAEGVIYGNFIVALLGVPWNILQFTAGAVFAALLAAALYKTPAKKYFAYNPEIEFDLKGYKNQQ